MRDKPRKLLHIDTIVHDGIPNRLDITEYRSGESLLAVTHRYDGISEPHLSAALHTHPYYEFELVYGGKGVQILSSSSVDMSRGQSCLRTPNSPHTTHEDPQDPLRSYNIRFTADFVPQEIPTRMLVGSGALCARLNEEELQNMIGTISVLTEEIRRGDAYSRLMMTSLLHEILVSFVRKCETNQSLREGVSRHVSDALRCIDENFRRDLSVSAIARTLGLNPHYLGSLFIEEIGKSIPQYILDMRLVLAAQLLSASALSVSEIAYECGFSSPSYFVLKFRERYGMTPRGYARERKE